MVQLIGAALGAVLGLISALLFNWALTRIEDNAIRNLDRDAAEQKRTMYGTVRRAVLTVDVVLFAVLGWFIAGWIAA